MGPAFTKEETASLGTLLNVVSTMRNRGIIIETSEGMKYLKGEEFDDYFEISEEDKALGDAIIVRTHSNPMIKRLAESMRNSKDAIAAKLLEKGLFDGTDT
jgi:microsomal dipeptidase-like Zn-dependent dipeptidase